jgi:hypothetical protein
LLDWLADVGADQLAFAAGANAPKLVQRFGDRVLAAAKRITQSPRMNRLGPRRAAIVRALDKSPDTLVQIGARAIAPHTDAIVRRQLALRLPRTPGLALLFELRDHCREPLDATPTWAALAAK